MQAIREAPAQQRGVPRRQENSGTSEGFRRGDQRLHVEVALRRCMAEESQNRSVSGNAARALHHNGGVVLDGLREFRASIESMHPAG